MTTSLLEDIDASVVKMKAKLATLNPNGTMDCIQYDKLEGAIEYAQAIRQKVVEIAKELYEDNGGSNDSQFEEGWNHCTLNILERLGCTDLA